MSATFITQQQFDDIDKCMSFLTQASSAVTRFINTLPWQLRAVAFNTIPQTIDNGPPTAKLWKEYSDRENYLSVNRHLDSLLYITDHIIAGVGGLSSADMKSPVSKLSNYVAPPKPPVLPESPRRTCLEILNLRELGLHVALYKALNTTENYRDVRFGISKILPRMIDFTSLLLQIAETMPLYPSQREELHFRAAVYPRLYTFGMSGMANLIAQQDRISILLEEATPFINPPNKDKSLARFKSDLEIAGVYLRQARRYCSEIAALRSS